MDFSQFVTQLFTTLAHESLALADVEVSKNDTDSIPVSAEMARHD